MATEAPQTAGQTSEPDEREAPAFRHTPWTFLRSMLLGMWATFRHPFSYSRIDLETGAMEHYSGNEETLNG
jgi:hypothetical protein